MRIPRRTTSGVRAGLVAPLGVLLALVIAGALWLASAWGSSQPATPGSTTSTGSSVAQSAATSSAASTPTASTPTASTPRASTPTASTASAEPLTRVPTTRSPTILSVSLADLGVSGAASVAVYDITDGDQLTAGSGTFETASIVKVDILVSLLVQRNGSLTASQKALAKSMITVSDNAAATTLFQAIGSASGLNRTNQTLGLVQTSAGTNGNWGLTRTTAADQIRLLQLVFVHNSVLSDASRAYVSSLMSSVTGDQDWGVTAAATDEDNIAVKNGWLPRTTTGLWDVTSIGCVEARGHRLLVVVLVTSARSMAAGVSTIEKAASTAVKQVVPS